VVAPAAGHDLDTRPADRVLVHSDLGLHKLAFDSVTGAVTALVDYGNAAWVDRHLEFRYFCFVAVPDVLLHLAGDDGLRSHEDDHDGGDLAPTPRTASTWNWGGGCSTTCSACR